MVGFHGCNKKLLGTSASLLVTSALLVLTRKLVETRIRMLKTTLGSCGAVLMMASNALSASEPCPACRAVKFMR